MLIDAMFLKILLGIHEEKYNWQGTHHLIYSKDSMIDC